MFRSALSNLSRCISLHSCVVSVVLIFSVTPCVRSQTELATILGRVTDQSCAVIHGAEVEIRDIDTGFSVTTTTNGEGLYKMPSLHPGRYIISVHKQGFKSVLTQLSLNVQDKVVRNFALQLGSTSESITVAAESEKINTNDSSVSTVVDGNFAQNRPTNGGTPEAFEMTALVAVIRFAEFLITKLVSRMRSKNGYGKQDVEIVNLKNEVRQLREWKHDVSVTLERANVMWSEFYAGGQLHVCCSHGNDQCERTDTGALKCAHGKQI